MKNNSGQKLLNKAKKIIPGGNQLLSKRSERFLPNLWPAYYSKAKGCKIWDLDGKMYYDFAGMGVTSCVLGYSDKDVNKSIEFAINNGSMATLNAPEEIELSEIMLKMHPWSKMIKYARSGGEACSIAIRIARAYTKKDIILFCGYHGWHDWYLSANIKNNKNLDDQLLPGLHSLGVPKSLNNTAIPFKYNDEKNFLNIVNKNYHKIAAVIMEPVRNIEPNQDFLMLVRKTTKKINSLLIFDEITSGFHENCGGYHLNYNINPDLAVFGKAMGNGTPISAIIGKKKIMQYSQKTFVSSTMWTDRIGFLASLATLKKMKKFKVQKKIVKLGKYIKYELKNIAKKNFLQIQIQGINSMPSFKFMYSDSEKMITFFTQEMLKEGFLASSSLTLSFAHDVKIIKKYLASCDKVFKKISFYKHKKKSIPLKSKIRDMNFKRLN